ncbi:hypothetical protein SYNTR_1991 [Candidatus Syntrophocurvum alkaliphilum]|uniref:Uncharacterized protein n=1 Tax=Candidatus Syntrophocurvum alkaliphilum TaxID=2293317 RepID=A0A6I6DDB0_9FIRM|nr:hypothetical protein SYNTR_1991 [Candidatus Syntrophocurvum alkaliphilum]
MNGIISTMLKMEIKTNEEHDEHVCSGDSIA